ncbi:alpha/beta fold hydrolase [Streptomyces sp. Je 1-369]|uniref:alpha/beta fold hydrolase n=1 Tax=Streptomyces sp. Je 1-369 TaxID=2966192 RepID=UPI0022863E05|nr:alpha/beta fold hydrolase [Streptomyces sp. Je 1-369]WAL93372.1 alpha/beta hydrolase [Streptomyces sp. Je 1-369]
MIEEYVRTVTAHGVPYTYRVLRQSDPATEMLGEPSAEPVIALGGVLEGLYDWAYLEGVVLPRASLVTVDLPGLDPAAFQGGDGLDLLCEGLASIVEDLGAARVNLYGYSLGAAVALQYTQGHPERVARLLLGGVPGDVTEEIGTHLRTAVGCARAGDADGFAALMADGLLCLDESHHVHRRELTRRYLRRFMRNAAQVPRKVDLLATALITRHRPLHGGLSGVPTLVFSGDHDHLNPPERQLVFAATIEGSRFVTFPDCDHMLPLQRPEVVTSLVASFLLDEPAAHASG